MPEKIKTGYLANINNYPDLEVHILVMRGRGNDELAPSKRLLEDYKELEKRHDRETAWEKTDYEHRFRAEIKNNLEAGLQIERIAFLTAFFEEDFRLICYEKDSPCHRFVLKDIIENEIEEMIKEGS